eukprot:g164.t1
MVGNFLVELERPGSSVDRTVFRIFTRPIQHMYTGVLKTAFNFCLTLQQLHEQYGMTEAIKVYCRIRPASASEKVLGWENALQIDQEHQCIFVPKEKGQSGFTFDHVFNENSEQEEVYSQSAAVLLPDVFNGYNATIFCYGQTGSGKTWTMTGDVAQSHSR